MKYLFGLILILSGCLANMTVIAQKTSKADTLYIKTNMHCENCEKKVQRNIGYEKGVSNLITNLDENTVTIIYRTDKTSQQKIVKAVEKLGYKVEILPKKKTNR